MNRDIRRKRIAESMTRAFIGACIITLIRYNFGINATLVFFAIWGIAFLFVLFIDILN